jgi:hypothetical protein
MAQRTFKTKILPNATATVFDCKEVLKMVQYSRLFRQLLHVHFKHLYLHTYIHLHSYIHVFTYIQLLHVHFQHLYLHTYIYINTYLHTIAARTFSAFVFAYKHLHYYIHVFTCNCRAYIFSICICLLTGLSVIPFIVFMAMYKMH